MASELPSNSLESLLVADEHVQATNVKGEDENKAEGDVETDQQINTSPFVKDPSPVSIPHIPPKVDGNLHIHAVLQCECDVTTCQFSNDGTLLAVGLVNGSIKVYSSDGGEFLHTLKDLESIVSSLPVTDLCFTTTSKSQSILLATYASGYVKCWHMWGWESMWTVLERKENGEDVSGEQRQTFCLSICPSNKQIVTGGSDSAIHLYDLNTHQRIQTYKASLNTGLMDGHRSHIFAVKFHPDIETEFISGGWDNTVQFWDTREEHAVRMIHGPHVCGQSLDIDSSTNKILSGSWRKDNTLEVWDYSSGKKVANIPSDPHGDSMIYTCQWMDEDHILAAGGQSNTLRVIDLLHLRVQSRLFGLPTSVFSSSVCPSEKGVGLIAASSGKQVILLVMDQ